MNDANTTDAVAGSGCLPGRNDGAGVITAAEPGVDAAETVSGAGQAWVSLRKVAKGAFSFPVMLGALLVGAVFWAELKFIVDPDLWWHLKTGELILSTHRCPTTDPYSYTSFGAPWMSAEWLGDVFLASIYRLKGLQGLYAANIAMASAIVLAIYGLATLRSRNSKAGFVATVLLLPLACPQFNLRPQMLGYLFLIFTLIAVDHFRQGKRRAICFLPPLFLVWINTHGSWIIGMGVVAVYLICGLFDFQSGSLEAQRWTSSQRLQLETVLMLSLAAIPITPYGTRLAMYPFTVASSLPVSVANVLEWFPIPFDAFFGKVFLVLVLGFFLVQMVFHLRWQAAETLLLFGGIGMACLHVRFLLLFVPFVAPILAAVAARWIASYDESKDKYAINFVFMAAILLCIVHYFPSNAEMKNKVAKRFPVEALEYMRQHPVPGPLFNTYGFGGFMIHSGYLTFIDGRSELFEVTGVLSDYMHITRLKPGALNVLNGYQIRSCLLGRDEPLSTVLASLPDWQKVYSDNVSVVYVKRDGTGPVGFSESASSNALIPQGSNFRVQER